MQRTSSLRVYLYPISSSALLNLSFFAFPLLVLAPTASPSFLYYVRFETGSNHLLTLLYLCLFVCVRVVMDSHPTQGVFTESVLKGQKGFCRDRTDSRSCTATERLSSATKIPKIDGVILAAPRLRHFSFSHYPHMYDPCTSATQTVMYAQVSRYRRTSNVGRLHLACTDQLFCRCESAHTTQ